MHGETNRRIVWWYPPITTFVIIPLENDGSRCREIQDEAERVGARLCRPEHATKDSNNTLPGSSGCSRGRWRACSQPERAQCWRGVKVRLCPGLVSLSELSLRDTVTGGEQQLLVSLRACCACAEHLFRAKRTIKMTIFASPQPPCCDDSPAALPAPLPPVLAVGAGCGEHRRGLSQSERRGAPARCDAVLLPNTESLVLHSDVTLLR